MSFPPLTVRVPATSANMGPGYDCLGMALDIWNTIELRPASGEVTSVTVEGEGAGELPGDSGNLVCRSMEALWLRVGIGGPRCAGQVQQPYTAQAGTRQQLGGHCGRARGSEPSIWLAIGAGRPAAVGYGDRGPPRQRYACLIWRDAIGGQPRRARHRLSCAGPPRVECRGPRPRCDYSY